MPRLLRIAASQASPLEAGASFEPFAADARSIVAADPGIQLLVYPELHLVGTEHVAESERLQLLNDSAVALDAPIVAELGALARELGVWLLPGSICERGPRGELFNTALVFSPRGELVAHYRKMFPWRPLEPYDMGVDFVVVDVDDVGRIGISICYDAWFPELTRHLGWMGAEVVVNVVKTTTADRFQELVLARANSIVNQTFTVSVNCAGPIGMGRSIVVDPEGAVIEESPDEQPALLVHTLDLDEVTRVRRDGTAGTNRMWSQLRPTDPTIDLPLYRGAIDPERWAVQGGIRPPAALD